MPPSRVSEPPRRADSLRIRARLLAEARLMLAENGPPVQLNDLARRAGVGVGTVYRHFATSQALVEALAIVRLEDMLTVARRAAAEADPWAGIVLVLREQVRLEIEYAEVREVLAATYDTHPDTSTAKAELEEITTGLLAAAQAAGLVRADLGAGDLRRLMCGVGYAANIGDGDHAALAELYLRVLCAGSKTA